MDSRQIEIIHDKSVYFYYLIKIYKTISYSSDTLPILILF